MTVYAKAAIAAALMMAVGIVVILKNGRTCSTCPPGPAAFNPSMSAADRRIATLPRLVEIGSTTCVPCQMMKPILDELTAEYAGKLDVVFVDVHQSPDEAKRFNIRVIPTQVFLDASGKELLRHEGFFPKTDILAKWKELGYDLSETPGAE